jgi:serine O-acetyltransferase
MSHAAALTVHGNSTISGMNIILEDIKAQREGLMGIGIWALLVYRFGHARFVVSNKIIRAPWTLVYVVLNRLAEILCGISIGSTARIGRRLSIEHHGCIVVHGSSVIGDDCLIRHGVTLGNTGYDDPLGAPTIGSRVQIGAGAKILGRITIGNDVIIGANAVVIDDVPDNVVVGGIPARLLKIEAQREM